MNRARDFHSPGEPAEPTSPWWPLFAGAILVLLVAIVYWPTLDNDFILIDLPDVKNNLATQSLQGLYNTWFKFGTFEGYYPLTYTTFWIEYQLWGLEPRGCHAVSMFLHAVTVLLVWRLLVRLALPGAWLAAAIFAVHPVEVASVAFIIERKNLLSCALALGSILAFLRFSPATTLGEANATSSTKGHGWAWYALAFGLYAAALLAKTVTASVPAVLLVIYWWKRGRVTWRDAAHTAPFFAVGLSLCYITIWVEHSLGAGGEEWRLSLIERVLLAGRAFWFYAGKLVWPHPLIFFYPRWEIDSRAWWQYLFPLTGVSVVFALWLARGRIGRGPLAAVLIFGGVMLPALGFFNIFFFRFSFVADQFQYHASIALIALAAVVICLAHRIRWLVFLTGAGLVLPLAVVTQQKTHVYKNNVTIWQDTAALDPDSWLASIELGFFAQERENYEEGLLRFRKALEICQKQALTFPTVSKYENEVAGRYVDLGFFQYQIGRSADAESSVRKAIEIREKLVRDHAGDSDFQDGLAWCYVDLALMQQKSGRPDDAVASYRKAIEVRERLARSFPALSKFREAVAVSSADVGLLLRDVGRPAEAESWFRKAIKIREELVRDVPTVPEYQASLAGYATVAGYQTNLAASYEDLALLQQARQQLNDALVSHRKALEIREKIARDNPAVSKCADDVIASHVAIGLLLRELRQPAESENSFRKAIEIREKLANNHPTIGKYKNNLAASYVDLGLLQHAAGRSAEAENLLAKSIEIRQKLVRDHPAASEYSSGLGWSYMHLATVQFETGRRADAESSCRKAIEIREKLVQDNPTLDDYRNELAASCGSLGNLLRAAGRTAEAEAADRRATEIREPPLRQSN